MAGLGRIDVKRGTAEEARHDRADHRGDERAGNAQRDQIGVDAVEDDDAARKHDRNGDQGADGATAHHVTLQPGKCRSPERGWAAMDPIYRRMRDDQAAMAGQRSSPVARSSAAAKAAISPGATSDTARISKPS